MLKILRTIPFLKERNLTKNEVFITNPIKEDIIGAYQAANVVIFLITNLDGFRIPILEAGIAKCPIISTNREPVMVLVKNGKTGLLTRNNDLFQLKETILKIITDKN